MCIVIISVVLDSISCFYFYESKINSHTMFDIDKILLFGKIKNSILELQFGLIQIQLAL